MKLKVYTADGSSSSDREFALPTFEGDKGVAALRQVVLAHQANARQGNASTKTRAEVAGSGKKLFRQKGSGTARQGTRRVPHQRHGGIAHGPKGQLAYKTRKLNKSEKKQSIASLITEKTLNKNLLVLNDFNNEIKKTKEMSSILKKFEILNSLIILDKTSKEKIEKSIRNIPNIKVRDINHFSAFDIIKFKKIVFTESSIKELEKKYS